MATIVNTDLTRKVADLARLDLTEKEVETYTRQLNDVLGYIDLLKEVDVQGVAPLNNPIELETPMSNDQARPSPRDEADHPKVLRGAPEVLYDGYKVPQII